MKNSDKEEILKIWLEENIKSHYFIDNSYWENNKQIVENEY